MGSLPRQRPFAAHAILTLDNCRFDGIEIQPKSKAVTNSGEMLFRRGQSSPAHFPVSVPVAGVSQKAAPASPGPARFSRSEW